jgi:adenylate cyclase class IV
MNLIELEIKALANNFDIAKLEALEYYVYSREKQLNHYFAYDNPDSLNNLLEAVKQFVGLSTYEELRTAFTTKKVSVRTREVTDIHGNHVVYFIVKYSLVDSNAANGNLRKEIELETDLSLSALDNLLKEQGLTYASKWSRERETYVNLDLSKPTICLDKNAGYGRLLEVEKLVQEEEIEATKPLLYATLSSLELEELDSELLSNMFAFYEANWKKYYGTDKLIWDDPEFIRSLDK